MDKPRLGFDLSLIAEAFGINRTTQCNTLEQWLSGTFILSPEEQHILDRIYDDIAEDADHWNEEELKVKAVGLLFFLANISVKSKIKVFYERPLSAEINGYHVAVVVDCMVATPMVFNTPKAPYFFLQEFKKGKGEKKDPEAQMLSAMLIAQARNQDTTPVYGGFLIGANWRFATLTGPDYCLSRQYNASHKPDLLQIVFILRKLKDLILSR